MDGNAGSTACFYFLCFGNSVDLGGGGETDQHYFLLHIDIGSSFKKLQETTQNDKFSACLCFFLIKQNANTLVAAAGVLFRTSPTQNKYRKRKAISPGN